MPIEMETLPDPEHMQVVPYEKKEMTVEEDGQERAPQPLCSVVIVTFRPGPVIFHSIQSALGQPDVTEVILVDNGDEAELYDAVRERFGERVKLIAGQGNVGFAKGCNLGVAASIAPYVLLLNPDCILSENAVSETLRVFQERPDTGMASARLENPDGSEQRGGRRNLMTPWTTLVEQLQLYRFAPDNPKFRRMNLDTDTPLDDVTEVECTSGAYMMLSRRTWDAIDGMDEDYFLHVEDVDFCMRLKKAGHPILFAPHIRVLHLRSTSDAFPVGIEWHKTSSACLYFYKHFGDSHSAMFLALLAVALFLRFLIKLVPATLRWAWGRIFGPDREARDARQEAEIRGAALFN